MEKYRKVKNQGKWNSNELIIFAGGISSSYRAINFTDKLGARLAANGNGTALFNIDSLEIQDYEELNQYKIEYQEKVHIDTKIGISISYIEEQCKKLKDEINLQLAIIDYAIPLLEEDIEVSKRLKKLSKELDILIYVMLPFDSKYRKSKLPTLEDLKYRGIAEFADIVWLIYKNYKTHKQEIIIAKNNLGKIGILDNTSKKQKKKAKNKKGGK